MRGKTPFLLSLLALGAPAAAWAAALQGTVLDAETGLPLEAVRILARGEELGRSGPEGAFALPDGAEGATLTFALPGYQPLLIADPTDGLTIALVPDHAANEEVVITSTRYSSEAHLSQTNLSNEELQRRNTVQDIPVLLEDTPGVFVSGDAGNGLGYTYFSLRGFDQRRVGVMINGIPLNDPEDHQVYWVDLPDFGASLEDVQIQRGVSNSIGGMHAIAGTVNLVTEQHQVQPSAHAEAWVGSYGTDKQALTWRSGLVGGRTSSIFRLSHLQSDGYRDRSATEQWALFWSGQVRTAKTETTVNIYTGHESSQQAWTGLSEAELAADRRQNPEAWEGAIDDFSQPHYELHHAWSLSDALTWTTSLYWIHGRGFYDNFKEDRSAADFGLDSALGVDADAELDLYRRKWVVKDQGGVVTRLEWEHTGGRLAVGGDVYDFHSDHWGEVTGVEGFTPADLGSGLEYYHYTGDKLAFSAFLDERWEVVDGLTLMGDLHYQHKTYAFMQEPSGGFSGDLRNAYEVTYDFFNPKGGVHYQLPLEVGGGALGVFAYAGVAQREPSDSDLFDTWDGPDDLGAQPLFGESEQVLKSDGSVDYVQWSDPSVQPEQVMDYEVGINWHTPVLSLTLDGYWMDFHNEIVPYGAVNDDGFAIKGNAARTVHKGIELGATACILKHHDFSIAASKSWDRYVDFQIHEDQWDWDTWEYLGTDSVDLSGNPIALFPDYLGSVRLDSDWGPVSSLLRFRAVGRQYLDNTGDVARSIDPWQVLDLGLGVDFGALGVRGLEGLTLDARLNNVLGAQYETWGYYDAWGEGNYKVPAAERNFLVGVRYDG